MSGRRVLWIVVAVVSLTALLPVGAASATASTTATGIPALNWYPGVSNPSGAGNNAHEYWLTFDTASYGRVVFVARPASGTLGHIDWALPRVPEPAHSSARITFHAQSMSAHDRRGFLSSIVYLDAPTFVALAQARQPIRQIGYRTLSTTGTAPIYSDFTGSLATEIGYGVFFGRDRRLGDTIYGPPNEPGYDCTQPNAQDRSLIGVWASPGATHVAIVIRGRVVAQGTPAHDPRVPGLALFDAVVAHASHVQNITVQSDTGTYSESLPACIDD
ncbi:MAG TPA: hypothetical protein VGO03_17750 [Acidimicrobiia bacterium]|jgi:hypothetical protein